MNFFVIFLLCLFVFVDEQFYIFRNSGKIPCYTKFREKFSICFSSDFVLKISAKFRHKIPAKFGQYLGKFVKPSQIWQ